MAYTLDFRTHTNTAPPCPTRAHTYTGEAIFDSAPTDWLLTFYCIKFQHQELILIWLHSLLMKHTFGKSQDYIYSHATSVGIFSDIFIGGYLRLCYKLIFNTFHHMDPPQPTISSLQRDTSQNLWLENQFWNFILNNNLITRFQKSTFR